MGKILKILKINILSIIALPILLIATICKLTAKALEKLAIILGMSIFSFALCMVFEAIKAPNLFLQVLGVLAIFVILFSIIIVLIRFCFSVIVLIWTCIINFFNTIYEYCHMGYLKLYESCEEDYKLIQLSGASTGYAFACLFYTILRGVSRIIILFASASLYLAIGLSAVLVISTILSIHHDLKQALGLSLTEYLSKSDTFSSVYGICVLVSLLATVVVTLISLGIEWHEWAMELNMTSAEYSEYVSRLMEQGELRLEDKNSSHTNTEEENKYVEKFSEHVSTLEQLQKDVDAALELADNPVLRSSFSKYLRTLTDITDTCDSYHCNVPASVFQRLIPQIQTLDKQRDNLTRMIAQHMETASDPVKTSVFFSGCNTLEKLEKRYKALCKTYHPDMESGDDETFKTLKEEYEKIKETFS
ncbi:MAG: hypothetical protein IJF07_04390 [Lachnospiraceae bacterium]|nr:hypothetical protein [Lachnospiraceae bacterium]